MNKIAVMAVACVLPAMTLAQPVPLGNVTAQSLSGQFVIHGGSASSLGFRSPSLVTNRNMVFLQPPLLAVSCERIKQALWRELGTTAPAEGKVHLYLRTARMGGEPTAVLSERLFGTWNYRVQLPDVIERERFVEAITEVLLLEIANRHAKNRPMAIPPWLACGLAAHVAASSQIDLTPAPPKSLQNGLNVGLIDVSARRMSPLSQAQDVLRMRPPLTFEQMSWTSPSRLPPEGALVFRSCAQMFVNQLLQLKDGPACLLKMLEDLPRRENWQIAFLTAFKTHFGSALDVEKWWSLQLAYYIGRDASQTWTAEESRKKLDLVLSVPVQVRTRPSDLPMRTTVPLQTIIREWDRVRQEQVLQAKLQELAVLRLRVSQDLVALVDDYRLVIQNYLQRRGRLNLVPFGFTTGFRNKAADEAVQLLTVLDSRRAALQPASPAPVAAAENTAVR